MNKKENDKLLKEKDELLQKWMNYWKKMIDS